MTYWIRAIIQLTNPSIHLAYKINTIYVKVKRLNNTNAKLT